MWGKRVDTVFEVDQQAHLDEMTGVINVKKAGEELAELAIVKAKEAEIARKKEAKRQKLEAQKKKKEQERIAKAEAQLRRLEEESDRENQRKSHKSRMNKAFGFAFSALAMLVRSAAEEDADNLRKSQRHSLPGNSPKQIGGGKGEVIDAEYTEEE